MTQGNHITRLVIAGGGTGGHVFPGIAVAEAMSEMSPLSVLWIGTDRNVEVRALESTPWIHRTLKVMPIKGTGIADRIKAVFTLPAATIRAMAWLREFRPHMVLGVGGYVSGPVMLAARSFKIPAAIHEQNAIPGLANRMAARFADMAFLTYGESAGYFKNVETELTGNPVRRSILDAARSTVSDARSVLILGGSQGAAALNRVTAAAIRTLWQSGRKIKVVHQTGAGADRETAEYYMKEGIDADVRPFINDMARAYSNASLVISRAGATTLAEITALGRPSILIPYPYAADNHQEKNARAMAVAGASLMFRESDIGAVRLACEIENIVMNPQRIEQMAQAARKLGKPDAAAQIARKLMKLAGRSVTLPVKVSGTSDRLKKGMLQRAGT